MSLVGKVAIITGGNRGIGRAIAIRLAEEHACVVIAARDEAASQETAKFINHLHSSQRAFAFTVDVMDRQSVDSLLEAVIRKLGGVDILVNNAGICRLACDFEDLGDVEWDEMLGVNLRGMIQITRAVVPLLKKQQSGKIINITSLAGEVGGLATSADYVTSKAAVIGLTKSLARALGPYNINVNAIAPGFVNTSMTADMKIDLRSIPLRRIAEPKDIANATLFLASDSSRCITGTTLDVNGGLYMK